MSLNKINGNTGIGPSIFSNRSGPASAVDEGLVLRNPTTQDWKRVSGQVYGKDKRRDDKRSDQDHQAEDKAKNEYWKNFVQARTPVQQASKQGDLIKNAPARLDERLARVEQRLAALEKQIGNKKNDDDYQVRDLTAQSMKDPDSPYKVYNSAYNSMIADLGGGKASYISDA